MLSVDIKDDDYQYVSKQALTSDKSSVEKRIRLSLEITLKSKMNLHSSEQTPSP